MCVTAEERITFKRVETRNNYFWKALKFTIFYLCKVAPKAMVNLEKVVQHYHEEVRDMRKLKPEILRGIMVEDSSV